MTGTRSKRSRSSTTCFNSRRARSPEHALRVLRRAADSESVVVRRRAFQVLATAEVDNRYRQTLESFLDRGSELLDPETISVLVDRDLSPSQVDAFMDEAECRCQSLGRGARSSPTGALRSSDRLRFHPSDSVQPVAGVLYPCGDDRPPPRGARKGRRSETASGPGISNLAGIAVTGRGRSGNRSRVPVGGRGRVFRRGRRRHQAAPARCPPSDTDHSRSLVSLDGIATSHSPRRHPARRGVDQPARRVARQVRLSGRHPNAGSRAARSGAQPQPQPSAGQRWRRRSTG